MKQSSFDPLIFTRELGSPWIYVKGPDELLAEVQDILSFTDPKEVRDYHRSLNDGGNPEYPEPIVMFDVDESRFLYGFWKKVEKILEAKRIDFSTDFKGVKKVPKLKYLTGIEYRPYQQEAIESSLAKCNGIIKISTSGGKTVIAAGITKSVQTNSLLIVPSITLMYQAAQSYVKFGVHEVGVFGDGKKSLSRHTIAYGGSISQALKTDPQLARSLENIDVLIFDEAHHIPARTWSQIFLACSNARFRIGLTGTPFESVDRESIRDVQVIGYFGDVICEVTARELAESGYIAKPKIFSIPVTEGKVNRGPVSTKKWRMGRDFNKIVSEGIVDHRQRNRLAVQISYILSKINNMRVLVLVSQIRHGKNLIDQMKHLGVRAVFLAGNQVVYTQDSDEPGKDEIVGLRSETVSRFASGDFDVLVGSPVLGEGFDLPGDMIQAMIIMTGGKGTVPVLQRLGRALRPKSGRNEVCIVDFWDSQHFYLENHSRTRFRQYESEGYEVFGFDQFMSDYSKGEKKNEERNEEAVG